MLRCHQQRTVRIPRVTADLVKSCQKLPCTHPARGSALYTGPKAARSFLGPAPGAAGLSLMCPGHGLTCAAFAAWMPPHCQPLVLCA